MSVISTANSDGLDAQKFYSTPPQIPAKDLEYSRLHVATNTFNWNASVVKLSYGGNVEIFGNFPIVSQKWTEKLKKSSTTFFEQTASDY